MAVVFTIPDDATQYRYPESAEDITIGRYISYLQDVEPTRPDCMKRIEAASAEMVLIINEAADLMPPDAPRHYPAVMDAARAYLAGKPTGKARKHLPDVLDRLEAAAGERRQAIEAISRQVYAREVLPYYARVVAHFTGVPLPRVMGEQGPPMAYNEVEAVYSKLIKALQDCPDPNEEARAIHFQGVTYRLPDRFMEKSTVIEFAEAAQFQSAAKDLEAGEWSALIDVCAVLMRPDGVSYDEAGYHERRALFVDLPLADAMRVAFFLMRRSVEYARSFQVYTLAYHLARLRRELRPSSTASVGI